MDRKGMHVGFELSPDLDRTDGRVSVHRQRWLARQRVAPVRRLQATEPAFGVDGPGLLCVAGFDGRFRHLSPAWSHLLGCPASALLGRPFAHLIHPDDRSACLAQLANLARERCRVQFECRWLGRDGAYCWLQWQAHCPPGRRLFHAVAQDVTELRRLRREVLDATDRERERLGRELHDGLCQNLAGIAALSAALARRLVAAGAADDAGEAAEIGALLNHAVVYARDMARGLCPAELRGAGLADALDTLADNVQALFGVDCAFRRPPACPALDAETAMHLYRIVQEAVHNALTHGRGRRIEIELRSGIGEGLVSIRDDGVGPPGPDVVRRSMGLQSMAYRAQWIGGSLVVQANAPVGTAVICSFPLPGAAPGRLGGAAA